MTGKPSAPAGAEGTETREEALVKIRTDGESNPAGSEAGRGKDGETGGNRDNPQPGHVVRCELDAAYTRNVTERFDGLTHPDGHDGVETLVDAWADPDLGWVDLTVPDAGIRLNIGAEQAQRLGFILIAESVRARQDPAWDGTPQALAGVEVPVQLVLLCLCAPCLDGEAGECHAPGCSRWMQPAPGWPSRESHGMTIIGTIQEGPGR